MILVADLLSLLRVLLTIGVVAFSISQSWRLAFITLVLAWVTDLADGAAARKWGSLRLSMPKLDSDGIADSILAFVSALVPVIYAWFHAPSGVTVILIELWLVSLVLGAMMALGMDDLQSRKTKKLIQINMPIFHGVLLIRAVTTWFAFMALGWFGALTTVLTMIVVAIKQKRKIQRWFAGAL